MIWSFGLALNFEIFNDLLNHLCKKKLRNFHFCSCCKNSYKPSLEIGHNEGREMEVIKKSFSGEKLKMESHENPYKSYDLYGGKANFNLQSFLKKDRAKSDFDKSVL
jgi:hypothetical protein